MFFRSYYHSKYKKVQTPHVIRHYAAGARLIGLSEQQIRRHLERLRESSVDNKSPYAQPPYAFYCNSRPSSEAKTKTPVAVHVPPTKLPDVSYFYINRPSMTTGITFYFLYYFFNKNWGLGICTKSALGLNGIRYSCEIL